MKKILFLLVASTLVGSVYSIDLKPVLGIQDVNLDRVDVEQRIQEKELYKSDPTQCSAIVYILFGSIRDSIEDEMIAKVIEYNDRTVSLDTVISAKGFLMETALKHENEYTRAWAGGTIAYAFPRDPQISKWLFDQYFFRDLDARRKGALLGIIKKGGYDDPYAILMVKDGLMADNAAQILNAIGCILDNHYRGMLPDLLVSQLSLEDRHEKNKETFKSEGEYTGGLNACHSLLSKAILEYKNDDTAEIYRPLINEIRERRLDEKMELKRNNANQSSDPT